MSYPVKTLWTLIAILFFVASIAIIVYRLIAGPTNISVLAILFILISTYALSKRW